MAALTLPSALQHNIQEILDRANRSGACVQAILLSTSEGVPLGRVYVADQPLHEDVLASLESVWAPASKQIPVLGLEKLHQVTAIYDHATLIHVYQSPMVITVLCGNQANLGAVRSAAIPSLLKALEPLHTTLVHSLKPDWQDDSVYQGGTTYYQ